MTRIFNSHKLNFWPVLSGVLVTILLFMGSSGFSHAFAIRPTGTDKEDIIFAFEVPATFPFFDREARALVTQMFTNPVHERATNLIFGCKDDPKEPDVCGDPGEDSTSASAAVLAGNQWNDNPPFELTSTTTGLCKQYIGKTIKAPYAAACWYMLFRDGEKKSAKGAYFDAKSGNVLLYRVHFGDMQFLHAMASRDGEAPRVTRARIMMWAEFTYKLATGALSRSVVLNQSGIPGMKDLFYNRGWTAQQLLIRGDGSYHAEKDFRDFAFGSLLHLIQDSFSRAHTRRALPTGDFCPGSQTLFAPGKVISFLSYASQNKMDHKNQDTQAALSANLSYVPPTAMDVGSVLRQFYVSGKPWNEVKNYLDCVFAIDDTAVAAGPGGPF